MRLALILCGWLVIASPAFAQRTSGQPTLAPKAAQPAARPTESQAASMNQATDQRLEQQVSTIQQRLQQEERRLQAQFAELAKMRAPAILKADQAALQRIEQLEQQVVADYQKRVEQILAGGEQKITTQPVAASPVQQPKRQPSAQPTPQSPKRSILGFWPFNQF